VLDHAAVGLKYTALVQGKNKVFMTQSNQLDQVAVLCVGTLNIPGQVISPIAIICCIQPLMRQYDNNKLSACVIYAYNSLKQMQRWWFV
jgi:hypothetical protein